MYYETGKHLTKDPETMKLLARKARKAEKRKQRHAELCHGLGLAA